MVKFEDRLIFILKSYSNADKLLYDIMNCGETLLVGGVLREYKENSLSLMPRDFDITVDTSDDILYEVIKKYNPTRNRFGGYKICYENLVIDLWCLKNTWAYREHKINCRPSEYSKRLQDTVFLNIDSIVYNMSKQIWYDDNYNTAIQSKVLDIILLDNPQIALNIVRSMIFVKKYSMIFSSDLIKVIYDYIKNNPNYLDNMVNEQKAHYQKVLFDAEDLKFQISKITNSF